ncbi:type IV toxin-antitoxin system AbiEi family antitoxin domain-containing protein [Gordonia sp. FQ]|uniref:type IV toxin-antitoxin system AbiEi family antitoxin domain-containing protein n=1 Tax=Gordonia sp. FQ TaxID=3446634 RepID=UPI003F848093
MGIENGVFSRHDLARLGVSKEELHRYLHDGVLVRLRRGWYLRAEAHDPAAVAAVRDGRCGRWWSRTDSRRLIDH